MNKFLFWVLTLVFSLILIFAVDYIGITYLIGDKYVPSEGVYEYTQSDDLITLEDFREKINSNEKIDIQEFEKMPIEIQIQQAKAFFLRIIVMIFCVLFSFVLVWPIKGKRIEFDVMLLDNSKKKTNMVRISLYVIVIMTAFFSSQNYPANYLLGWVQTLLVVIALLVFIVWILNIIYAFAVRRAAKSNRIETD